MPWYDFSDLFGLELPQDASRALQKTGKVTTDEELAYYLLFTDHIKITPGNEIEHHLVKRGSRAPSSHLQDGRSEPSRKAA